jgi:hypothetical protein
MANFTYVVPQKRVVIFYSYKSGNTSLVEYVYELFSPNFLLNKNIAFQRRFLRSPAISMSPLNGYRLVKLSKFTGVVLTRNPYQRAVSAYVNKFIRDGNKSIVSHSNLEQFSNIFLSYSQKHGICKDPMQGITFNEFLLTIKKMKLERRDSKGVAINAHWNVQVPDVLADKNFFSKQVRLENIQTDIKILNDLLGLNKTFPHSRGTAHHGKSSDLNLENLPSFYIEKMGFELIPDNFLSLDMKLLIQEIYEIDFLKFGYEF